MKLQALVLLGLLCSSAFSAITSSDTVEVSGITYAVGLDTNNCGVTRSSGNTLQQTTMWTTGLTAGDCVPQAILSVGSNIWVVLKITLAGDLLTAANAKGGLTSVYDWVIPTASLTSSNVVIASIDTTNTQADFGLFTYGMQFASKNAGGTWGTFSVTDVTTCSTTIQVEGDTQSTTYFLVDETGTVTSVSGNGVFAAFSTSNDNLDAYTDATKPCSGLILSIAGALVSLVAMFF